MKAEVNRCLRFVQFVSTLAGAPQGTNNLPHGIWFTKIVRVLLIHPGELSIVKFVTICRQELGPPSFHGATYHRRRPAGVSISERILPGLITGFHQVP